MNNDEQEKKLEQELREGLDRPDETTTDSVSGDDVAPAHIAARRPKIAGESVPMPGPAPAPRPVAPPEAPHHSSAGVVILQWLSYAFWAWLVVGLLWLVNLTLSSTLLDSDTSSMIPYALAASIVLLPVAFFVDFFYRKHEPIKKQSAAMVIMVIHAVLYALATIGTLIGAVFIALNMFINDTFAFDTNESVVLYTTLFTALAFGFVFLRVLNPFKTKLFAKVFAFTMLGLSTALIVLGFVGPALSAFSLRNDRLIDSGLPEVSSSIMEYANDHDGLPSSLSDLELHGDASSIVKKGLVTYKPEGKVDTTTSFYGKYRYQLCVTYNKASQYPDYYYSGGVSSAEDSSSIGYTTYPSTYNHKAGENCFKLETYRYNNQPIVDDTPAE